MSFLLECPHCGPRDVNEFRYQGEVTRRPRSQPSLRDLTEYVYFRDNVAGVQREWWYHRVGCGIWFVAERDTRTNEVLRTEVPAAQLPVRESGPVEGAAGEPGASPAPAEPTPVPDTPAV